MPQTFVIPKQVGLIGGAVAPASVLRFYQSGTSTPQFVYTDSGLTSGVTSITADSSGVFAKVYLNPNATANYRVTLETSAGVVTWTEDDIAKNPLTQASVGETLYPRTAAEIAAGVTPTNYTYEPGDVRRYGADPTGVSSSTTAIQSAITVGSTVYFPAGTYLAQGLSQSTSYQRLIALGEVTIKKNANGTILTCTGDNVELNGIGFRGDASSPTYTGNGVLMSGENPRLINCGVRWISGVPLTCTKNHAQIIGTCDLYQTTDATGTGYDIVIGTSGTATLYHQLIGIYSSQATGGIKLIDTGSHVISGGQFGKLFIDAGTSPAGVNGGMTQGARILGAVTVEISSAVFSGNQFGTVAIAFAAGTSGCSMDRSNIYATGATITNAGNDNNLIERQQSTGTGCQIKVGPDSAANGVIVDISTGLQTFPYNISIPNTCAYKLLNAAGTNAAQVNMTSGDNFQMTNNYGAIQFSASGGVYQFVSLPTSAAGLPAGALWNSAGTVKVA